MFENSSDVLEYYLEQHPELRVEWEKDHKLKYDPRVTRIGRFMRKTSLDELPQLWNVVRGEMSLVGPRPIVTAEIPKYGSYFGLYTMVKPGITGLWQVSGRNNTTYEQRVQLDAYYVRNWSPWMDLYLMLRTIRIVLFAKGAY
jgi:lipopolysaccharide/colanic/teichoic acid biosynthesis glycosyltransferase